LHYKEVMNDPITQSNDLITCSTSKNNHSVASQLEDDIFKFDPSM